MENIKKYLLSIGISILLMLIFSFFFNILNYFDALNNNIYKIILILLSITSILTGSYYLGSKTNQKGYLNGVIFGIIISSLYFLLSLFINEKQTLSSLLYYLIIIITSGIGGSIGINKQITEKTQ